MRISIIVAMAANRVIGAEGTLPWRLPADLKRFRSLTMGKPMVMGRKTYESIGRPLPGRTSIVLTTDAGFRAEGCVVVHSLDEALARAGDADEVMIIGGSAVYGAALPLAGRIYMTVLNRPFPGDVLFPPFDASAWIEVERRVVDDDADMPEGYRFIVLERVGT
ncbi:MAG: dihydrofolate reductase [Methylotetracoccus sp.]